MCLHLVKCLLETCEHFLLDGILCNPEVRCFVHHSEHATGPYFSPLFIKKKRIPLGNG